MNMAAIGMFSTADLEFDPLVSFMKIKQELNENEKKIKTSEITDDDKYNLIYDGLNNNHNYYCYILPVLFYLY